MRGALIKKDVGGNDAKKGDPITKDRLVYLVTRQDHVEEGRAIYANVKQPLRYIEHKADCLHRTVQTAVLIETQWDPGLGHLATGPAYKF